jgi:hypothetical protein
MATKSFASTATEVVWEIQSSSESYRVEQAIYWNWKTSITRGRGGSSTLGEPFSQGVSIYVHTRQEENDRIHSYFRNEPNQGLIHHCSKVFNEAANEGTLRKVPFSGPSLG